MNKKTKTTLAKSSSLDKETKALVKLLAKEVGKLREGFAAHAGLVSKIHAEHVELSKKVRKLYTDPIFAVPQELKQKVEAQADVILKLNVQAKDTDHALRDLKLKLEELETNVGADNDRLNTLEEQLTAPTEHAAPPKVGPEPTQPSVTVTDKDGNPVLA